MTTTFSFSNSIRSRLGRSCVIGLLLCGVVHADDAAQTTPQEIPPASPPAITAEPTEAHDAPASTLTLESSTDEILAALEATGAQLSTLAADVVLEELDDTLGREVYRAGRLLVERTTDESGAKSSRILVRFTERGDERRSVEELSEFLLADGKLIERDHRNRKEVTRELPRAEADDVLTLGRGPFPLPIGQSPADVRMNFEVTRLPDDAEQPGKIVMELRPREGTRLADRIEQIICWIDPTIALPVVIQTVEPSSAKIVTTRLTNVKLGEPLPQGTFQLPPIDEKSWRIEFVPME